MYSLKNTQKGHFIIRGKRGRGSSTPWALCVHVPTPVANAIITAAEEEVSRAIKKREKARGSGAAEGSNKHSTFIQETNVNNQCGPEVNSELL